MRNTITKASTEVGNVCVKEFWGSGQTLIFTALKRIRKDQNKSLNADAIVFFHQAGTINNWEYKFLQNTKDKRHLTPNQLTSRQRINQKVISVVAKRGLRESAPTNSYGLASHKDVLVRRTKLPTALNYCGMH